MKYSAILRRIIVLGSLAFLLWPRPGMSQVSSYLIDTGPLRIRDQFFLGMGFLAFDPVSADVLDKGEWQIDLIGTVTNDFAAPRSSATKSRAGRVGRSKPQ